MDRNFEVSIIIFFPQFYKILLRTWKQSANGGKDVI